MVSSFDSDNEVQQPRLMTPLLSLCISFDVLIPHAPFGRIQDAQPFQGHPRLSQSFLSYSPNCCSAFLNTKDRIVAQMTFGNIPKNQVIKCSSIPQSVVSHSVNFTSSSSDAFGREALSTNGAQVKVLYICKLAVTQGCLISCHLTKSDDTFAASVTMLIRRSALLVMRLPPLP